MVVHARTLVGAVLAHCVDALIECAQYVALDTIAVSSDRKHIEQLMIFMYNNRDLLHR